MIVIYITMRQREGYLASCVCILFTFLVEECRLENTSLNELKHYHEITKTVLLMKKKNIHIF